MSLPPRPPRAALRFDGITPLTFHQGDPGRFALTVGQSSYGEPACRIVLGEFVENGELDLTDWTTEDYLLQWQEALSMLVENDEARVILMTWASHPASGRVRRGGRFQRSGTEVRIQEQLYVPGDHQCIVDTMGTVIDNEEMESETEDGDRISEWGTTVESIRAFLDPG